MLKKRFRLGHNFVDCERNYIHLEETCLVPCETFTSTSLVYILNNMSCIMRKPFLNPKFQASGCTARFVSETQKTGFLGTWLIYPTDSI